MRLLEFISFSDKITGRPKQVISDSWEDRSCILDTGVNLFCWKRSADSTISSYLEHLISGELSPISCSVNAHNIREKLLHARVSWGREHEPAGDPFWEDVTRLTNEFLTLSGKSDAVVHLKVIQDDACRKFHTDGYSLRLFTTYLGKGTQWLPEKAVNRKGLGKSNKNIVKDSSLIAQMDSFEVGILKGELPGRPNKTKGIVHRSPELEKERGKRVILRIDI